MSLKEVPKVNAHFFLILNHKNKHHEKSSFIINNSFFCIYFNG